MGGQVGAASVRAGNVVGVGDWGKDRLLPDCIRSLSSHQVIGIRNHNAIRSWQHVLEPLSGYLWLGALVWDNPQKYCGAWNFGADDSSHIAVAEVVDKFIQYWGEGAWEDLSDQDAPHEAKLLKPSCDKAQAELKWHRVLGIDECLQKTGGWYKMFYDWKHAESMYEFCPKKIAEYVERAKKRNLLWTEK